MHSLFDQFSRRVLIVDDENDIYVQFQVALQSRNPATDLDHLAVRLYGEPVKTDFIPDFEVDYANQGEIAVERVKTALEEKRPYALAFVDMRMPPGIDGLETIKQIWALDSAVQIVICTAYSDYSWSEIHDRLSSHDQFLILKKPFESSEIQQLALSLTEKWGLAAQAAMRMSDLKDIVGRRALELAETNAHLEREVAERKRAEEALRLTQFSVDHAPDLIFWLDEKGHFLDCNETTSQTLGYSPERLAGMRIMNVVVGCSDETWAERWKQINQQGRLLIEVQMLCQDGNILPVELMGYYLEYGNCKYCCMVGRDITFRVEAENERQTIENRMRQTQKFESMGVMAGGIAHHFNNLLMSVMGHAELLQRDVAPESSQHLYASRILETARRAAELSGQMLAYSGSGMISSREIQLNEIVHQTDILLQASAVPGVRVEYVLAENLPSMQGDPSQLQQVMVNVVTNAIEAIVEKGRGNAAEGVVQITTGFLPNGPEGPVLIPLADQSFSGPCLSLSVTDTGCGMDEKMRRCLFDPFSTTKLTGRGLGLPVVWGIMRGHKGAIAVQSEPGFGSVFTLYFPIATRTPPQSLIAATKAPIQQWTGQGVVLLADDEPYVLEVARTILERSGLTVLGANDGQEAVDLFEKTPDEIGCVLLDLTMPRLDGAHAMARILQIRPEAKVVICSGYGENDVMRRFEGLKVAGFLQKPFRLAELIDTVRHLLEEIRK
ncbi:MAG TPA: response regulator [Candidatus Sumerlaeota bacterium]|nr:response regulator [Candidatus Sumerlaeota bacterium]